MSTIVRMEYGMLRLYFVFLFHCLALSNEDMSVNSMEYPDYYSDELNSPPTTQKPIIPNSKRVKIKFHRTTVLPTSNSPENSFNEDNMLNLPDKSGSLDIESSPNIISPNDFNASEKSNIRNIQKPFGISITPNKFNFPDLSNSEDPYFETTTSMISSKPVTIRFKRKRTTRFNTTPTSTESITESEYPDIEGGHGQTSPATTQKSTFSKSVRRRIRISRKPTSSSTESTTLSLNYQDNFNMPNFTDTQIIESTPKTFANKGLRFGSQSTISDENLIPSSDNLNVDYSENIIDNTTYEYPTTITAKTTFRSKLKQITTMKTNKYSRLTTPKSTTSNEMSTTGEPVFDELPIESINPTLSSQYNPTSMKQNNIISQEVRTEITKVEPTGKPKYIPYKARSKSSSIVSSFPASHSSRTYSRFNRKTKSINSLINPTASLGFEDENNSSRVVSTHTYRHYTGKVASSMPSSTKSRTYSRYTRPTITSKSTSKYSRYTKPSKSSTTLLQDIEPSIPVMEDDMASPASVIAVDEFLMDSMPTTKTFKLKVNGEILDPNSLPTSTGYDF